MWQSSPLERCSFETIRIAGNDFDKAIIKYMRKKYNLLIGDRTAENMKINIGSAYPRRTGFHGYHRSKFGFRAAKTFTVSSDEMIEAWKNDSSYCGLYSFVLERTPPSWHRISVNRVFVLPAAERSAFDKLLQERTGIAVYLRMPSHV